MNKLLISCLITACGLVQAGYSQAAGTIKVYEKDNAIQCSVPAIAGPNGESKVYSFKDDTTNDCSNDQAYSISLEGVDSALTITLMNGHSDKCDLGQEWEIELLTVKQPSTTEVVNIGAIAQMPDNSVVVPGLVKVATRMNGDGDTFHGTLSCIRVERK